MILTLPLSGHVIQWVLLLATLQAQWDMSSSENNKEVTINVNPSLCLPGFQCVHGVCVSGTTCRCDEGWTGFLCSTLDSTAAVPPTPIPLQSPSTISTEAGMEGDELNAKTAGDDTDGGVEQEGKRICIPGFECVHGFCITSPANAIGCLCEEGWEGIFCQVPITTANEEVDNNLHTPNITIINSTRSPSIPDPSLPVEHQGMHTPLEGYGPLADLSLRICAVGFECRYGNCTIGMGFSCICEPGFKGSFCQEPVSLDCGAHGKLLINPNRCECEPMYTGFRCTEYIPLTNKTGRTDDNSTSADITNPIEAEQGMYAPLEGFGPLSDLSLRKCAAGFECRYGNCTKESLGCDCEPQFVGTFCQDPCTRDCGPNGRCMIKPERCECDKKYTGVNCTDVRPVEKVKTGNGPSPWYAVGVCISAFLVIGVMVLVVLYWLWRRGNLTMLRLVYWYQGLEDDDGRQYDAFVSYASTKIDRQFVMDHLIPNLEDQMKFTLCIHERDFMPGKYITANIMESVRMSRRTLLVISPAFVSRNWCQFEFQLAVAEMIAKKHRILPVILGDLKEIKQESTMCDTLQRVLNTVTYLQYPGSTASDQELQRFWKRLQLSMPKKTNSVSESESNSTSLHPIMQPSQTNMSSCDKNFSLQGTKMSDTALDIDSVSVETIKSSGDRAGNTAASKRDRRWPSSNKVIVWIQEKLKSRRKSVDISSSQAANARICHDAYIDLVKNAQSQLKEPEINV